ncbi:tRNA pseudouridine synthase B [Candidatus Gastranaerophilus sp. (ex Termes propinquus)]|nr:tRNA pseudouridine synthase B [Candidatus Gastranaerophilus sp. (ex Termes propinquus)]
MFGFINVKKPKGITSFDVIYKLRKILKIKKIGHSGTLDPLASGVLPIAVGGATRLIEYLSDDKKYVATIKFGQSSTTYDEEGEKTEFVEPDFTEADLLGALEDFQGPILQKPPAYSAIKIGGQKLYNLARKGAQMPEVAKREVTVHDIKLLGFQSGQAEIEVHCSAGTYIRSIANDIGEKLGCGAYLADLSRTSAGRFEIEDTVEIEDVSEGSILNPLDVLVLPRYELSEEEFLRVKNGNFIKLEARLEEKFQAGTKISLAYLNKLAAIGVVFYNEAGIIIKVEKGVSVE